MASFNKVMLMGNLTREPELRYTPSGMAICSLSIATNRKFRSQSGEDKEEVCFVEMTAFGKQAESSNNYLGKGSQVFVEGRLKFDQWTQKDNGQKRNKLSVSIESITFLGAPTGKAGQNFQNNDSSNQAQPTQQRAPQQQAQPTQQQNNQNQNQGFQPPEMPDFDIDDVEDDIPF